MSSDVRWLLNRRGLSHFPPNTLFPNGDEESFPNSGEKTFNRQWHLWAKWPAFESRANSEISEFGPRFDQWRSCVVFGTLLGFPRILQWFPDKNFMVFAWPKCAQICRSRQLVYFSQQNLHQNLINHFIIVNGENDWFSPLEKETGEGEVPNRRLFRSSGVVQRSRRNREPSGNAVC